MPIETAVFDGDDQPETLHFAGLQDGRVIGCLTFIPHPLNAQPAWQLRGMATDERLRKRGIGSRLLEFAEKSIRQRGMGELLLWCNARTSAAAFYERHGWQRISDVFEVPTIGPHVKMTKRLP